MVDINWVQIGVGFVAGVLCSWFVSDLVFYVRNSEDNND
jgi:hypothetical protein